MVKIKESFEMNKKRVQFLTVLFLQLYTVPTSLTRDLTHTCFSYTKYLREILF